MAAFVKCSRQPAAPFTNFSYMNANSCSATTHAAGPSVDDEPYSSFVAVLILICLGVGCAHRLEYIPPPFMDQPILTSPSGEKICALHRTPLITVDGFGVGPGMMICSTSDAVQASGYYPNHVSGSLQSNCVFSVSRRITYCLHCEEEFQQAITAAKKQRELRRQRAVGKESSSK